MRTLLRVGGIAGTLAGAAALGLALAAHAGIAVSALLVAAGLAAGLATAKWLPPAWYGRQFGAGLRAGLIACLIAVPATLLALLDLAPQGNALLAVGPASLTPVAALAGGATITVALAVVLATLAALMLAAFSARLFAADKGARFVKAVERAREASQPLHQEGVFAPVLARRTAVPLAAVAGGTSSMARLDHPGAVRLDRPSAAPPLPPYAVPRRTLAPATPPDGIADTSGTTLSRRAVSPPARRTASPAIHALPREMEPELEPEPEPLIASPSAPAPAAPAAVPPPTGGAPALKRRGGGRPPAARLTPEMIEALAAWARDTEEDEAAGANGNAATKERQPVESTYLNAPAPAAKRKRKKNATRDWIC